MLTWNLLNNHMSMRKPKRLIQLWEFSQLYNEREPCSRKIIHPHLWYQLQVQGFSKPSSGSKICWKGLQNSLNTVAFRAMVYYRKKIQIKISQESRDIEQGLDGSWSGVPVVLSPWSYGWHQFLLAMCDVVHTVLSPRCPEFSLGLNHILLHGWP